MVAAEEELVAAQADVKIKDKDKNNVKDNVLDVEIETNKDNIKDRDNNKVVAEAEKAAEAADVK